MRGDVSFVSHRGRRGRGVGAWLGAAGYGTTSDFLLHASSFLMGLCYNVAETVTYSEE
jgi:hypothetical protein